jgi:phenylalanine-4-hydroxylase
MADTIQRQYITIHDRACNEFIDGLSTIDFGSKHIPAHTDISQKLMNMTGWGIV